MKAMILTQYGDNANFELAELPQPSVEAGHRRRASHRLRPGRRPHHLGLQGEVAFGSGLGHEAALAL